MKEIPSHPPKVNSLQQQAARVIVEIGTDGKVKIFPAVESDGELNRVMDALRREFFQEFFRS